MADAMTARTKIAIHLVGAPYILALVLHVACRRDEADNRPGSSPAEGATKAEASNLLVFPEALYAEDTSVNAFVRQAMEVCTRGEYDTFRLLWSVRQDPLTRSEFETGWQAVQEIRIRALERVLLAADSQGTDSETKTQPVYALYAEVQLDPSLPAGKNEPHRDVVLMVVREHDEWRLGHAPKSMREWIRARVGDERFAPGNLTNDIPAALPG